MHLYPAHSLYQYKPLRRLRYGRGSGVHSPAAYTFITQVARPRNGHYYAQAELKQWHKKNTQEKLPWSLLLLWFRMCARLAPKAVCYNTPSPLLHKAAKQASQSIEEDPPTYPTQPYLAYCTLCHYVTNHLKQKHCLGVLLNTPQQLRSQPNWDAPLRQLEQAVVIDFYTCIVILPHQRNLHLYRSTL